VEYLPGIGERWVCYGLKEILEGKGRRDSNVITKRYKYSHLKRSLALDAIVF
jgi:hypothetical protein